MALTKMIDKKQNPKDSPRKSGTFGFLSEHTGLIPLRVVTIQLQIFRRFEHLRPNATLQRGNKLDSHNSVTYN